METPDPASNRRAVTVSADQDSEAREGIRQFNEAAMAASRNQDAAAKASLWTEDTRFLAPGQEL
ncbi:MAG: hypothetical protein QOI70_543, partial [Microbacteriaceae bacterium]|nr:hypothetical protein [Microbacteriaceae bacterium]